MGLYIALTSLQLRDASNARIAIEPKSDKASGLFEHEFSKAEEARLLDLGAIRLPEGTEQHDEPSPTESLDSEPSKSVAPEKPADKKSAKKVDEPTDLLNG